jgi:hypothetical protein
LRNYTRFPVDSALRFSKEPDFMDWDRLKIHGLDLTTFSVEIFVIAWRLDILINSFCRYE